jgi:anaerobic magnesium-protoporphyrin IX monomethyl ester cyclase
LWKHSIPSRNIHPGLSRGNNETEKNGSTDREEGSEIMNILLFNPSWGASVHRQRYNRSWPPLDLLNVAAILRRDGFNVSFQDARACTIPPDRFKEGAKRADRVLVSTSPLDRWQCPNIDLDPLIGWTELIHPDKLVLCGAHGTIFPEETMNLTGARIILRGEPEASVLELFRALERGGDALSSVPSLSFVHGTKVLHTPAALPVDLKALPLPAYDLTQPSGYEYEVLGKPLAVLETARGCPHHCTYCLKTMYGRTLRHKPVEQVESEVASVLGLGYRFIYFMDLEFTLDRSRVMNLCRMLRRFQVQWCCQTRADAVDPELLREMASSGCRLIHYGIESGSSKTMQRIGKNIAPIQIENAIRWTGAAHIATAAFFLLGFPWESGESLKETERLARRLNPTYASFHFVTFYAGTELAHAVSERRPWWAQRGTQGPRAGLLQRIYLRYCLRPSYAKELFLNGRNRFSAVGLFLRFLRGLSSSPSSTDSAHRG